MGFAANLAIVTYTFNDAELASGLIDSLADQTVTPRQIVVVDDGSAPAFVPPGSVVPVRFIRLDRNRGATFAKKTGMDAADAKFILSVDADVRLAPDWLEKTLPLAARADIGLVSSAMRYDSGDDALSRYMALVYGYDPQPGETAYVPGPVWLIRRDVWRQTGGLSGYHEPIGEDSYLCQRVRSAGLKLWIAPGICARQVRRLSPPAMVKRGFSWQGAILRRRFDSGAPAGEVVGVFVHSVAKRLPDVVRADLVFAYFELLYLAHGLIRLMEWTQAGEARSFVEAVAALMGEYPALSALLTADLAALGHTLPAVAAPSEKGATGAAQALAGLFPEDLLRILEEAAPALGAQRTETDFSFYMGDKTKE